MYTHVYLSYTYVTLHIPYTYVYTGGGSLNDIIHNRDKSKLPVIPMVEKLRLLSGVARGLAELHAAGIVHADIKVSRRVRIYIYSLIIICIGMCIAFLIYILHTLINLSYATYLFTI